MPEQFDEAMKKHVSLPMEEYTAIARVVRIAESALCPTLTCDRCCFSAGRDCMLADALDVVLDEPQEGEGMA